MLPIKIALSHVKQGMITADDVISPSGQLVIPKNTALNPRLISRLKLYNVPYVYVIITEDVAATLNHAAEITKTVNPEKNTREFKEFHRSYDNHSDLLKEAFTAVIEKPKAIYNPEPVINMILELASKVKNPMHLMNTLQLLREYDDPVYVHSLSVALISHSIATNLHLDEATIRSLMLACAFHDIGKLRIPEEILTKPGRLSDEEYAVVKLHPQHGYAILSAARFPEEIQLAALLHHERYNGTGYPSGITGDKIPLFAKIIAIADVYDAMTARRSYRKEICSFDVIATLEEEGYQKYDAQILLPFLTGIAQSHINTKVRLSNSLEGTIVMINQHKLSKPVVNVDGTFLDLSKQTDLYIVELL